MQTLDDLFDELIRFALRVPAAVLLLALVGHDPASGQTPTYVDAKIGTGMECVPGYYGQAWPGSVHREAWRGDAGWHAYAFCIGEGGKPVYVYRTCAHGECMSMSAVYQTIGNLITTSVGKDRAEVVQAYTNTNPTLYHCGIRPPGVAAPAVPMPGTPPAGSARAKACDELMAAMHKDWPTTNTVPVPVTPTYVVKLNGTVPTRPAYTLTDGVRGTKEVGRATVGQRCNIDTPTLASGNDLWAQYGPEFLHGRVALCAKK